MKEKVAIVTGGAGGIGSAVCRAFTKEGIGVAIADLDAAGANDLADELVAAGGEALGVEVEITSEESVIGAVEHTIEHFGRIDFLVHCAGIIIKAPVLELSAQDWSRTLDTHLTGAFLFSKTVGRYLVEQGAGGRVVFLSSVAARAPMPERGAYTPAKAGLVGLAGVLSLEWADYNINVNAVCPGVVLTPATEAIYQREPDLRALRLRRTPAGREVDPEEVADLVLFLCSDKASNINGTAIPIDGAFLNNAFMLEDD